MAGSRLLACRSGVLVLCYLHSTAKHNPTAEPALSVLLLNHPNENYLTPLGNEPGNGNGLEIADRPYVEPIPETIFLYKKKKKGGHVR